MESESKNLEDLEDSVASRVETMNTSKCPDGAEPVTDANVEKEDGYAEREIDVSIQSSEKRHSMVQISSPSGMGDIKEIQLNHGIETEQDRTKLPTKDVRKSKKGWVRHIVAILALSSIVLANMNRQCFNQALVSMTKPSHKPQMIDDQIRPEDIPTTTSINNLVIIDTLEGATSSDVTTRADSFSQDETTTYQSTSTIDHDDTSEDHFDWSQTQVGLLQAGFSYGYTPFMIVSGRLSEIYGAKWIVFLSGFGSAFCCLMAPFSAYHSFNLLLASRVLMGICQTGVSPALYALLTRWLPPTESTVYLPMIKVGVMLGLTSGSLVSGFFHWRTTFYLVGFIGALWSILWTVLVTSDPGDHALISKGEREYIIFKIKKANKGRKQSVGAARRKSAPWLNIMTNPVVLAFMFCKFTNKLSTDTQSMQIPMYLKNTFNISKELNGTLNGVSYAIQASFTGLVAWSAKEIITRKAFGLNKTNVRRLFQGTCNFGMGLAYLLISFNGDSLPIICGCVLFNSVAAMFGAGGEAVTPIDISLDYSASIMAIANTAANLSGIVLPPMVSFVLGDQEDSTERWTKVWWLISVIMFSGGLVYTTFMDATFQEFDKSDEPKIKLAATDITDKSKTPSVDKSIIEMSVITK